MYPSPISPCDNRCAYVWYVGGMHNEVEVGCEADGALAPSVALPPQFKLEVAAFSPLQFKVEVANAPLGPSIARRRSPSTKLMQGRVHTARGVEFGAEAQHGFTLLKPEGKQMLLPLLLVLLPQRPSNCLAAAIAAASNSTGGGTGGRSAIIGTKNALFSDKALYESFESSSNGDELGASDVPSVAAAAEAEQPKTGSAIVVPTP